jgi:nucleoside-diphosphate-sugar epimerase
MILVTGSQGYIAHELDFGAREVMRLDLLSGTELPLCYSKIGNKKELLEQVEVVVHTADLRLQDYNQDEVQRTKKKATEFFKALCDAPRLKKVVLTSSCSVYGDQSDEIHEGSRTSPTSFYAESKLNVEEALRASGIPGATLRFGTAYGLNQRTREDLLVNQMLISLKNKKNMELRGLEAYRPYIHFYDFARSLEAFALDKRYGLFNIVESNWTKSKILDLLRPYYPKALEVLKIRHDKPDRRNYFVRPQEHVTCHHSLETYLLEQLR